MCFLLAYICYPSSSHYIRLSEHHPSPPPPPSKSLPQPSIVSNSKTSNHAWPLQPPLHFPSQNKTKTDFRPSQHAINSSTYFSVSVAILASSLSILVCISSSFTFLSSIRASTCSLANLVCSWSCDCRAST